MFLATFPARFAATNCYVLAAAEGEECLVVDPGVGVAGDLDELVRRHGLRPAAVLLTHGHVDHVFSVTRVCDDHGIAASVHPADRYRLVDPLAGLPGDLAAMLAATPGLGGGWREPAEVEPLEHGQQLSVAGLELRVLHAPGHTEGSVMFHLPAVPDRVDAGSTLLSGDVLFAGSIGRCDLPGGDPERMRRSLVEQVLPLPDDALVLPGHGPATTIGHERVANPFLLDLARVG